MFDDVWKDLEKPKTRRQINKHDMNQSEPNITNFTRLENTKISKPVEYGTYMLDDVWKYLEKPKARRQISKYDMNQFVQKQMI